jgi:hypothetical protein
VARGIATPATANSKIENGSGDLVSGCVSRRMDTNWQFSRRARPKKKPRRVDQPQPGIVSYDCGRVRGIGCARRLHRSRQLCLRCRQSRLIYPATLVWRNYDMIFDAHDFRMGATSKKGRRSLAAWRRRRETHSRTLYPAAIRAIIPRSLQCPAVAFPLGVAR